jgi:hypothetical protein
MPLTTADHLHEKKSEFSQYTQNWNPNLRIWRIQDPASCKFRFHSISKILAAPKATDKEDWDFFVLSQVCYLIQLELNFQKYPSHYGIKDSSEIICCDCKGATDDSLFVVIGNVGWNLHDMIRIPTIKRRFDLEP